MTSCRNCGREIIFETGHWRHRDNRFLSCDISSTSSGLKAEPADPNEEVPF